MGVRGRRNRDLRVEIRDEGRVSHRERDCRANPDSGKDSGLRSAPTVDSLSGRQTRRNLYKSKDIEKTDSLQNPVWQRLGTERSHHQPRGRETSIQSSSGTQNRKEEAPADSLRLTRAHEYSKSRRFKEAESIPVSQKVPSRRRESSLQIRSPPRDQQREEGWRSSRRLPGHRSRIPTDDPRDKEKGKGKALAELDDGSESEEEDDSDDGGITHRNFELGSGSETRIAQTDATFKIPTALLLTPLNPSNPALLVAPNEQAVSERQAPERMEEAGLSDWAEEELRPTMPVTLINL